MSNRTELRARVREELDDTGGSPTWSDSLLDDLLVEAGGWYSRLWPMQAEAYRDVAAGQRSLDVPPGTFGVAQVECPPGVVLLQEASGATGSPGLAGLRQSWSRWGSKVYLSNPAGGSEVGTGSLVMRVRLPWARLDPSEDWNGPEDDERLLILWAVSEAWAWLDGKDRKAGTLTQAGVMTARYAAELEREVQARTRAATSRRLDEV